MKIHSLNGYISTLYLIEEPQGLLLFDSGCLHDVDLVEKYITQKLKRPMSDLRLIALTHSHPDHVGGAELFQRRWNTPIAAHAEALKWYSGFSGFILYIVDVILTYYVAKKLKKSLFANLFFKRSFKINHKIQEGTRLPLFEDWSVISTRGHTDIDLSFYNEKEKTCYVADALIKLKKGYSRPYPIHHPQDYRNALTKLAQLPIDSFLLAHSGAHPIDPLEIQKIRESVPSSPRTHRSLLLIFLKRLIKSKESTHPLK